MSREQFDDSRMERLQQRLRALEFVINKVKFLDGVYVPEVALTTSSSQIAHRLGRRPRGFLVLSVTPDAAVGLSTTQPTDSAFVALEASASCTADLWFW